MKNRKSQVRKGKLAVGEALIRGFAVFIEDYLF